MDTELSKVRARNAKKRERQAGKALSGGSVAQRSHVVGLVIALVLWAAAVFLLGAEAFLLAGEGAGATPILIADAVFLLAGILAGAVFLQFVRPQRVRQTGQIIVMALTSLAAMLIAWGTMYVARRTGPFLEESAGFLLPMVLAPLLATILLDGVTGIAVGVWTALFMSVLAGRSFPLLLTGIVASVVVAHSGQNVRTRSRVFRIGVAAGLSEILCVLGLAALRWETPDTVLVLLEAGACVLSAFFSAVIVLLILPFFESMFRITTDITLLELSDFGHPLLQRLAIEAPGTYHHSLIVASLAQAAADEVGANSLLTRVCSYFHDIGKLTKPGFFAENIHLQNNPHDDLLPSMSTLVITSHVKEGMSLAMVHKLPDPIRKVIREHHGTSLVSFFHHKARTRLEEKTAGAENTAMGGQKRVDENDFRYAGPRPSSRESAIVCLADPVEAASRCMEKTTPSHIENLVNHIVNARVQDGQLDDCDLTLAELTKVKRSFVFTLTNMLHGRVAYPKDEDRDNQYTEPAQGGQAEDRKADAVPDGQGRAIGQESPMGGHLSRPDG